MALLIDLISSGNNLAPGLIDVLTLYVFPVVLSLAVIWGIWIGIGFAKAKDEAARNQAKQRFIKAIATIFIIAILYLIIAGVGGKLSLKPPGSGR